MITISKDSDFYRPYIYGKYRIDNIYFYNENGIIITNPHGWLENQKGDIYSIVLNIDDIKLKRKEDFKIKSAFMMSKGNDFGELKADLYINANVVELKFSHYEKLYEQIRAIYVGKDYIGTKFNVEECVKYLKNNYYTYTGLLDNLVKDFSAKTYDLDERILDEFILNIRNIGEKLLKEKAYIENYSVEDYIKEIENGKEGL